ncbi:MAG: chemotaxis protein MotB, partial [Pseudomonadota bacterium]|nr:chemotaxis protein MotB [Pseudomonadota bacterium]
EKAIEKASANDPGLADAAKSLQIDSVAQGLRVQLVDQEKVAFFPNGSADMLMSTRTLLAKVS